MSDVTINIIKNGPLIVNGPVDLKDSEGKVYPAQNGWHFAGVARRQKSPFATARTRRSGSRPPRAQFLNHPKVKGC